MNANETRENLYLEELGDDLDRKSMKEITFSKRHEGKSSSALISY